MGKYPNLHSTNKGRELVAESNAKKKAIEYTKAVIGDAQYNDSIDSLLAVVSPKMECAFSSAEVSAPSQFTINFAIDNHNLENGFYAREIGIYARLEGTEDEILFAYTNGGNYVDYIPDKLIPIDAQMVEAIINIGDAEDVTIVKNDGTFITWKDLNNHNTDPNAHGGILASVDTKISEATAPVLAQLNGGLDKLESHNTDVLSHPAITAAIAAILGSDNWQDVPVATLKNIKNLLGFGGIVAQRLETNGYVKFANGFTIQWGQDKSRETITFPISFTQAKYVTCATHVGEESNVNIIIKQDYGSSLTSTYFLDTYTRQVYVYWICIGK